jgi:hypothetical protein
MHIPHRAKLFMAYKMTTAIWILAVISSAIFILQWYMDWPSAFGFIWPIMWALAETRTKLLHFSFHFNLDIYKPKEEK